MSKYQYDIICIGLGPAGMAVSIMGSEMGLNVCAIEKNKIGGECMNVGCIPSKALLRMAKNRYGVQKFPGLKLDQVQVPKVYHPFQKIAQDIKYINDTKTQKMFDKVDLILGEGHAEFVDNHTVKVGERTVTAKRIFVATGTRPFIPPIPGIENVDFLTNETVFNLETIPKSLTIVGGGAIGAELGQAFARLGSKVTIVHIDEHLLPFGDEEPGRLLQEAFDEENIRVLNMMKIIKAEAKNDKIYLYTDKGETLESDKLLMAAGRTPSLANLKLENAGIKYTSKGIKVNKHLQTSKKNVYAVGDCNGHFLLSHAAMHQGMIALMNTMMPKFIKQNFKKFVVPWTVFTEPQISHVGMTQPELDQKNIKYDIIEARYEDYGAAIAENIQTGFVKVYASSLGKIYGVSIVGEGSGEMINEWALAIQKRARLHDIMLLQHSFPTMGFLSKRVAENWMMKKTESSTLKRIVRFLF